MNNTTLDAMNDALLSPADFITLMFERTDEDGVLYIPGWHYDNPGWEVNAPGSTDDGASYRCKMNWNLFKYEKVLAEFKAVYAALQHIAAAGDLFGASPEEAKAALADESVFAVWNTSVRTLDEGEFDTERVETIYDKQDTMEWVKAIAARLAAGETLESFEKKRWRNIWISPSPRRRSLIGVLIWSTNTRRPKSDWATVCAPTTCTFVRAAFAACWH